jgi:ferrochelatase
LSPAAGGKNKIDKIAAGCCRTSATVTNGSDDQATEDRAVKARIEAAVRELDRFRRREASATGPEPGARHPDAAFDGAGAGGSRPAPEAGPSAMRLVPPVPSAAFSATRQAGTNADDDDDDLFAPDPPVTPAWPKALGEAPDRSVLTDLNVGPDRGLIGPDPGDAQAERNGSASPGESVAQEQWVEVELGAEAPAAPAVDLPAAAERERAPEPQSDPFAAITAAIAPRAKGEQTGWFGSRKGPEALPAPEPETAPPEMVDLDPVLRALQSVALRRAEAQPADISSVAATVDVSGESLAEQPADAGPIGILLVNRGAPDAPTARAVRRYLREFLSDRRVIEKDTFAWQLSLRAVVLPFRPRSKARAYRAIWNREAKESPLKTVTRSQAEQLGDTLALACHDVTVDWAMRYGSPSLDSRIKALITKGCERIVLVPLYPQYSSMTTATACDEAFRVLMRLRNQPSLRIAPPYYANPVYVDAVASSIRDYLAKLSFTPEVILASYRGLPQEYVEKGDPYYEQCNRTTELVRERLGMPEGKLVMAFQSRFGRAKWLRPYTDEIVRRLAKEGIRNVAVVTPGFATDCLETLEEIAIENAHSFKKRGGENFAFIPCLNDTERGMQVIREIALRELKGWL